MSKKEFFTKTLLAGAVGALTGSTQGAGLGLIVRLCPGGRAMKVMVTLGGILLIPVLTEAVSKFYTPLILNLGHDEDDDDPKFDDLLKDLEV